MRPYAHDAFAGLIGVGRTDITPPAGIYCRSWGASRHDTPAGVHRPLTCTALALRERADAAPLVLVGLDLGWWKNPSDEWSVRGALIDALGIAPERVIVNLAHTHAGPSISRDDAKLPGGQLIDGYLNDVRDAVIAAARSALRDAAPGTLAWEYGQCALARNRDLADPARARDLCGFNPGVPADGTVLVGRAADTAGRVIATVVNYACHPTTLAWENRLISPDWIGGLRDIVEPATGGAPCLFVQGPSGDQSPRDQYTGDAAVADANGRQLGHAVAGVLAGMLPAGTMLAYAGAVESGAPLGVWKSAAAAPSTTLVARRIDLELALKEDLPSVAQIERDIAACTDHVLGERLRRKRGVRRTVGDGTTSVMPIWLWRIGDAVLLAHPNEAFARLQGELRAQFPGRAIAALNLSNGGSVGYLPPRAVYGRDLYQVWQSPFAAGCHEAMVAACARAIGELVPAATTASA